MAEVTGYFEVPEEDQKKAKVFFDRGKTVADTGNYDYAIEMYMQGLALDPDSRDAHQALREISLKRKASGGKGVGMFEKLAIKKPSKDDKQNMLNAEKLLAKEPGDTDLMLAVLQAALKGGLYDTVLWMGPNLFKANTDLEKKRDINKYLALKDVYKALGYAGMGTWKQAAEACQAAAAMKPDDMDLQNELKNIGAQHTMAEGNYGTAASFRDSIRDMKTQEKLLRQDQDFQSADFKVQQIKEAEEELAAEPNEPGKMMKLVDALEKTEEAEYENRAIELLTQWYDRTKQYRFRLRVGEIVIRQMQRMERSKRAAVKENPKDEELIKDYKEFRKEQLEVELQEYRDRVENYPTETKYKFEVARREFELGKFDEAIPTLQQARMDPKFKFKAGIILGRAFFEATYLDEADETLAQLISEYHAGGDEDSKSMYYWRGRVLEKKGNAPDAIKHYSKLAQWDFGYKDVQARIKALRAAAKPT